MSDRVKRFWNVAGRIRSGQEVFKSHGVGSGHDPRDTGHFTDQATLTREVFSSYQRVGPVDLTRKPITLKPCCLQGTQGKPRKGFPKEGSKAGVFEVGALRSKQVPSIK